MPAELRGRISIDDSQANAALRRFEQNSKTVAGRVGSHFEQIFRRPPSGERRAEQFFSGVGGGLTGATSGPNAIIGMLGGLGRGIGLGAGAAVGIGAIAETLVRVRDEEQKTKEKSKELDLELRHVTHAIDWEVAADGAEKIGESLRAAQKNARHLRDEMGQFSFTRHPFFSVGKEIGSGLGIAHSVEERRDKKEEEIAKNASKQVKARREITESLKGELAIINAEIRGSEAAANWEKRRLEYQKELRDLRRRGATPQDIGLISQRYLTEKGGFFEQRTEERNASGIRQSALYRANPSSGLAQPQQDIGELRDRMKEIRRQQVSPNINDEQRRKLEEERLDVQNKIDNATLEAAGMSPRERQEQQLAAQRRKVAADQLKKNKGLINVRRDMSGNVIGGTDPFTMQKVDLPPGESAGHGMAWELAKHMESPGQMMGFQGSDEFNRFFHPQIGGGMGPTEPPKEENDKDTDLGNVADKLDDISGKIDKYWGGN